MLAWCHQQALPALRARLQVLLVLLVLHLQVLLPPQQRLLVLQVLLVQAQAQEASADSAASLSASC